MILFNVMVYNNVGGCKRTPEQGRVPDLLRSKGNDLRHDWDVGCEGPDWAAIVICLQGANQ